MKKILELTQEQIKDNKKSELIDDLMAVSTIMDDYWRFHPANPKQENVVEEFRKLEAVKEKIELDLKEIDA